MKFSGISSIHFLLIAAIVLAIPAAGQADVIDDHIAAVGGDAAIANLKTFKRTGKVAIGGMIGNFGGPYEQGAVVRAKVYTRTDLGVSADAEGWNGKIGWKRDGLGGLRQVEGPDLATIKSIGEVDQIVEIYRQYGRAAFKQGEDVSFGGKSYHVLDIVGAPLQIYIDPESKMIAGTRIVIDDPASGQEVVIATSYSDYAKFGGVMMPNHQNTDIASGAITIDIVFDKTEIGVSLADSLFEMPAQ